MAGTTIAYGEITILDLIDTATYIYYSANEDGTGASTAPDANTKYIGIYDGPVLEGGQPSVPPTGTIWSKYVGEDGNGINSITYYYLTNNSSNMPSASDITSTDMETPTSTKRFLWQKEVIKYTNGTSQTTVSLLGVYGDKGEDGADGILYDIQTNHEKIYKFFDSSKIAVFSPKSISFKAYKTENGKSSLMHPNSDYDTDIALAGYTDNKNFSHLWYFLNKLTGQKGEQKENLLTVARTIENDAISFNFHSLFDYSVSEGLDNNQSADVADFEKFINLLKTENGCFIYKIFKHSSYQESPEEINLLAIKPIQFEFGTSEDMAKFALTANDIQMAVNNSKLVFDATDGLTVRNGGLHIIGTDGTTLMEYDPNGSALRIVGSGTFSGTIYAEDGNFKGDVTATTLTASAGNIGGFIIGANSLYSSDKNKSIELLGADGKIYAKNITLGIGAQVEEYIKFSSKSSEGSESSEGAFLRNPDKANGVFLEAGKIKLTDKGILQLGSIALDGETSTIAGSNWSITPDRAEFKNINVSGKISTVVFEQNHVQSVGGSMIFKPSYKVESYKSDINGDILTLDREFLGKIDEDTIKNYVYLVKADGSLIQERISIVRKDDENKTVTLSSSLDLSSDNDSNSLTSSNGSSPLVSLIDIGTEGSLIIGINSNDGETGFLRPCGLTIAEFHNNNSFQNPKVFLGDLDKSGITLMGNQGLKGFGLYSENVYLTGSLTTQINNEDYESTYAGINTLNGAIASKFDQNIGVAPDSSKIVFWAGSASTANEDIQKCPLQITEKGSLYAAQGLFEGAIISKSIIKGTDIYAARIHDEGDSPNGLSFYDTSNGIVFYNGDPYARPYTEMENFTKEKFEENKTLYYICDDTKKEYRQCTDEDAYNSKISYYTKTVEKEVFSIGNNGLKYGKDKYFIDIANGKIKFIGDEIQTPFLRLKDNQILGFHIIENSEEVYTNISFNKGKLSFGLNETQEDFVINSDEIQLNKETVKMNKTVLFGERLKYEQTTGGYNLYVL